MAPAGAPVAPNPADTLNEAFRLFSEASAGLEHAYSELQGKVARLTEELAAANGELRRQFEAKLELAERLQMLLDAVPAGVVVVDAAGSVETANPAARKLFHRALAGLSWEALKSRHLVPADTPDEWLLHGEEEAGSRRVVVSQSAPAARGASIVLLQDVTAAHELTRRMEHNERLAAMGEMAAGLAHQLRTPLAAAMLYCGLLQRPGADEEERINHARKMTARLQHLERLIQDVLLFARGDVLGRERLRASSLVEAVAGTFEPLARARGIGFAAQAGEASDGCLSGNREALVSALSALLENALHACAEGPSPGDVRLEAQCAGGSIRFTVRDNGPGIPPAVRERMFEPFYTTRAEGTGLGLAIAHGVARAHGGSIEVSGGYGGGAEIVLSIPAAREQERTSAEGVA